MQIFKVFNFVWGTADETAIVLVCEYFDLL